MNPVILATGAITGLGVALLVREALPAPPDLRAALERLDAPAHIPAAKTTVAGRVAARLATRARLPRRDLDLLQKSAERFVLEKLVGVLAGLALPAAFGGVALLLGIGL